MYKNANKVIKGKTKFVKNMTARHSIASDRLRRNISKVGPTVSHTSPPDHEEIILPSLMTGNGTAAGTEAPPTPALLTVARSRGVERRSANFGLEARGETDTSTAPSSLLNSATSNQTVRVLNREKLLSTMNKVINAEQGSVPEWERQMNEKNAAKNKKSSKTSQISFLLLERKLVHAIRSLHSETICTTAGPKLTSRMLLPHYKLSDLKNFLHFFQSVDEDYSGDLDIDEWVKFFHAMNKSVSHQQARIMFNKVDKNGDGYLSVSDLVPVIFSHANGEQKGHILQFLEMELSKRKLVGNEYLTEEGLEMLFEHYDVRLVGFLRVSLVREKIKALELPDEPRVAILSELSDHDEDEMLNFAEFRRLFEDYIVATE